MKRKKILIVADSNNETVKLIKQWLICYDIDFVSIDTQRDFFKIEHYNVLSDSFTFYVGQHSYLSSDFDTVYFHRGALRLKNRLNVVANKGQFDDIRNAFNYYMTGYEKTIKELTDIVFSQKNLFGGNNGGRVNKIEMLLTAKKVGFQIPKTIITTKKSELVKFSESVESFITKSLDLNMLFFDSEKKKMMHNLTTKIDCLDNLPEVFPASIFQENIEKFIELRIFYIDEKVYTAAIFSQNTQNTVQDYRNYNKENPNRVIPYKLPKSILLKLDKFKEIVKLRMGSIDMLVTNAGKYYFLEVNPQGQFLGISNYCNYKLEKVVAEKLIM